MNEKRIALLNTKTGDFPGVFQYFLDEKAYWNTPFLSSPSSGDPLFVIFGRIMPYFLSFVKKKRTGARLGGEARVIRPLQGFSTLGLPFPERCPLAVDVGRALIAETASL